MSSINFEIKIGIFIFFGLVLLAIVTFSIGDFLFEPGYHIKVILNFADGVQEAAPVRLAGIEIGEVKKANIFSDPDTGQTKVKLLLWLSNNAKIEQDATVVVNTLGLIGEKYVEILPGTPGGPLLADGDTITGYDSVSMQKLTQKGYNIAEKLEKMIDSINFLLEKVKLKEGTVGKLIMEDKVHRDVEEIVTDVKEMVKDVKKNPWKLLHKPKNEE